MATLAAPEQRTAKASREVPQAESSSAHVRRPGFGSQVAAALVTIPTQPLPLAVLLAGVAIAAAVAFRPVTDRYAFYSSGEYRLDTATGEVAWCLPENAPAGTTRVSCSAAVK